MRTSPSSPDSALLGTPQLADLREPQRVSAIMRDLLVSSLLLLLSAPAIASSAFEEKCLAFRPEEVVPGSTRNVLEYVAANTTLTFPDNAASCNRGKQVVAVNLCRIALAIQTTGESSIVFEAWLPETWSGRFLATGNGGIDGCMALFVVTRWSYTG